MKEKSKSIIQAVIGAVIMIIGIVLCVNTYVVKGNKAYAFSLLVTIIGAVVLISGLYNTFCKSEKKPVDAKVIAQAALCAALCYVGATFIKIDIPVGTERTMFHFGNVFCVLAALLIGGTWGGQAGGLEAGQGVPRQPGGRAAHHAHRHRQGHARDRRKGVLIWPSVC